MSSTSKQEKIFQRISKETGLHPSIVRKIIKYFFLAIRKIMKKNGEISLHGLFKIRLRPHYKKKVLQNPDINLHKRVSGNKKKRKSNEH